MHRIKWLLSEKLYMYCDEGIKTNAKVFECTMKISNEKLGQIAVILI